MTTRNARQWYGLLVKQSSTAVQQRWISGKLCIWCVRWLNIVRMMQEGASPFERYYWTKCDYGLWKPNRQNSKAELYSSQSVSKRCHFASTRGSFIRFIKRLKNETLDSLNQWHRWCPCKEIAHPYSRQVKPTNWRREGQPVGVVTGATGDSIPHNECLISCEHGGE